jgi:acetate kinase
LVLNAGSSSLKAALFAVPTLTRQMTLHLDGVASGSGGGHRADANGARTPITWSGGTHADAVRWLVEHLADAQPVAIGHRVVHGGPAFTAPVLIDADVLAQLRALIPLAPLHEPANVHGIAAAGQAFPGVPQVACFDTAFHAEQSWVARTYALPARYFAAGVRRYGFHGLSYQAIAQALPQVAPALATGRVIVAHLGNGASLCALRAGRSVATTMGFSAIDGLPMGTRSGQIDPGVLLYWLQHDGLTPAQISDLLNRQAGLLGLSGISGDMRVLLQSPAPAARAAIDYFVERVVQAIGSLAAALDGVDGLVFTAGIGEHAAEVRARIVGRLGWLGLHLDPTANAQHGPCISQPGPVSAWVIPTDEERVLAEQTWSTLRPA